MIYKNIEFHNVAELNKLEELPGIRLQRFPTEVINRLGVMDHSNGRLVAHASTGCEIRFVTKSDRIKIALSSTDCDGDIIIYCGDFFHSMYRLQHGVIEDIRLDKSESFSKIKQQAMEIRRFSTDVWRIMISRSYNASGIMNVAFHNIETFGHEVRPPEKDEAPTLKWLAYGSSITNGSGATLNHNSYIQQAARRLGVDVFNKGIGGACHCEAEVADYLSKETWDFATLELGVNMREVFTTQEFESRVRYLVSTMIEKNPSKPVVLITIYPNSSDFLLEENSKSSIANIEFSNVIRNLVSELKHKNLYLMEGSEILTDFNALTCDLIHPSDYGHILMGENLAVKLKNILSEIKLN